MPGPMRNLLFVAAMLASHASMVAAFAPPASLALHLRSPAATAVSGRSFLPHRVSRPRSWNSFLCTSTSTWLSQSMTPAFSAGTSRVWLKPGFGVR